MSSTEPAATRLADYAPPPFLIDEAGLDFELDEARTLVRAKLRVRRNPAAEPAADLVLDGHGLDTRSVRIDGEAVSGNRFEIAAQTLTVRDAPDAFVLDTEVAIAPGANKSLEGLYASSGIGAFCHANQRRFDDASGDGYRFLSKHVLAIDAFNPQSAARLLGAASRWRRLDAERRCCCGVSWSEF